MWKKYKNPMKPKVASLKRSIKLINLQSNQEKKKKEANWKSQKWKTGWHY